MISSKSYITKSKKSINDDLRREFIKSSTDETFKKLCARLKLDDEILMKYTSKLETTSCELKNCSKCKGLDKCKNEVNGHVYYPIVEKDYLEFIYKPCKYFKENAIKNTTTFFETPKILRNASLSNVVIEKQRGEILKYIKDFLKKKVNNEECKGLYLSGSFGSGKSYLLSALLNELSNKGFRTVNVYYPSLLKRLKASFNEYNYDEVLDEIMTSDILLLDDIGAENNSPWARDEVLGTILQYRMDNDLSTFFTSNFTIEELEKVLSETSKGVDEIKARRIVERIKYLTIELTLISDNKRK
ncbi:MAG: primosomal protein DnaI [Bacilli bacterium]|nr:primosomal protein DnaI [Bacilli bacterium]